MRVIYNLNDEWSIFFFLSNIFYLSEEIKKRRQMKTRERSCAYMCKDDTSQSYIGSIWKKKKERQKK